MKSNKKEKDYDVSRYRTPDGYTSDIAVFTITSEKTKAYAPPKMDLKLMLIKRAQQDTEGNSNIEAGKWALPGGFVTPEETAMEAASRELEEETGIAGIHLKHFGVYDKPGRDPRGWIISNAHYAIVPEHRLFERKANDDAAEVELFPCTKSRAASFSIRPCQYHPPCYHSYNTRFTANYSSKAILTRAVHILGTAGSLADHNG